MLFAEVEAELGSWKEFGGYSIYEKQIEQSHNDKREYRLLKLDNQLKVLLIHDPETDRASASLDVNIGDSSNPDDLQGLAHFCEHLLFMGSVKYPKVNEYDSYLSKHSGYSNASTSINRTNYHFEVGHEWLEGALDRFSRFFIDPLFDKNCTETEINAVDSEYKGYKQDDDWRILHVDRLVDNPGYMWYLFSIGNLETLKENPESLGLDVREMLLKFYSDNYSANIMNLVVLGRESLDQLSEWVVEKFSDVLNKNKAAPSFKDCIDPNKALMTQTFIKPVMDIKKMFVRFPIPIQELFYEAKPISYICHLVHREGPGSLLTFLKKKNWVNEIASDLLPGEFGFDYLIIEIELTDEGLDNYESILVYIFEYIEMLKTTGVQQWVFDELKTIYDTRFRFTSKDSSVNYSTYLSEQMRRKIPLERIISQNSVFRVFNPDVIREHISELRPDNFRVVVVAQQFPNDLAPTKKEKWFSVDYRVTPIREELNDRLKTISLNPDFMLPDVNEFIPKKLDVLKEDVVEKTKQPDLIKETEIIRLWHKKDDTFWVPKCNVCVRLRSPLIYTTPRNFVLSMVYQVLLNDTLAGHIFDANVAGLYNYTSIDQRGILLGFGGYTDKVPLLMEKVFEIMKNFEIDKDRFRVSKTEMMREFGNFSLETPSCHSDYYLDHILYQRLWSIDDLLREIKDVEADDIQTFYPTLLSNIHIEALLVGNIERDHAISLMENIQSILSPRPLMPSQFIDYRGTKLPAGKHYVYQQTVKNSSETNSAITYHIPFGYYSNKRLRMMARIFEQISDEPCFNQLRTREQLGYSVSNSRCNRKGNIGYEIRITSKCKPVYLENRIIEFLTSLRETIEEMSDTEYQSQVDSIITLKSEKYQRLDEEFDDYWDSVNDGTYEFDYSEVDIKQLGLITKANLLEFYDEYISPFSSTSSSLSVHLESQIESNETQSDSKITSEFMYSVLIHTKVCDKSTMKENDLKKVIDEYEKEHGVINKSTAQDFLEKCQEKELVDSISSQTLDDIIDKLERGFSSLSTRDHTKLPDNYIVIDDILKFKMGMPMSAGPASCYTFNYP